MGERLQKLLATSGHGSRRQIEEWIRNGRVTLNGRTATLGERAEASDRIELDGRTLAHSSPYSPREVLLYHKPSSEVTTRADPEGRPTVFDRLPAPRTGRWVVIGRLDVNTTGLLLFTTDGALANRLMHPSSQIEREYLVRIHGAPGLETLAALRSGLMLEDGWAKFIKVEASREPGVDEKASAGTGSSHTWFRVVLCEGRNREVRRLWQAAGFEVSRLMRIRFADVTLPRDLRPGQWRVMDAAQARQL